MRRLGVVFVMLVLTGMAAGQVWAATYSVTIDETKFVPSTLKVKTGDSITFINTTDATQSAKTTSTLGFNTGNIGPGSSKTITVDTAGSYTYSSAYNSTLTGTITVEGTSTSTTTTTESTAAATTTTKGGQEMPVSGTTEVLMALIGGGIGFIIFGIASNRFGYLLGGSSTEPGVNEQGIVEITPVSSNHSEQE